MVEGWGKQSKLQNSHLKMQNETFKISLAVGCWLFCNDH
jgi:hypothetical protein